ncbi:hypothetical protein X992_5955 [Burkholderia pseudomallei MSHR5492]|nr:hypothetical protein X992_5955 [Burkholderia pseudomallei MSHR5492]
MRPESGFDLRICATVRLIRCLPWLGDSRKAARSRRVG